MLSYMSFTHSVLKVSHSVLGFCFLNQILQILDSYIILDDNLEFDVKEIIPNVNGGTDVVLSF